MIFPLEIFPSMRTCRPALIAALPLLIAAVPALSETVPRVIETRPLKLIGDGASPGAPAAPGMITITTPALRLVGDGAGPPPRSEIPSRTIVIETRPLKLIGSKP